MNKVQKGESGSPIYISTDEKISRHFGKSLRTQDESHGDYFLIEKGRDDSQVGREH
jgi:V8-like Glu-specific endopeptidase